VIKDQNKLAKDLEDQAAGIDRQIAAREKRAKEREGTRSQAADAAGFSQTLNNEAPGDAANFNRNRNTRETLYQGHQEIDATKAVAEISKGGADIKGALQALYDAHAYVNAETLAAMRRLEAQAKAHGQQISTIATTGQH
jgi:hypothetical protein